MFNGYPHRRIFIQLEYDAINTKLRKLRNRMNVKEPEISVDLHGTTNRPLIG